MRIFNPAGLPVGWIVGKIRTPTLAATVFVKGTYILKPDGIAEPASEPDAPGGDVHHDDNPESALRYESDWAPFKPKADLLLVGTCHPPDGKAVSTCRVAFAVGACSKSLLVLGDRRSIEGDPLPFSRLPLRYEAAFGGPASRWNPLGKPIPNIEDPARPTGSTKEQSAPAGFGPIHRTWKPRIGRTGSYGGNWRKERWPWFPDDFDWTYFNAAPDDQQVEGYLRGDEEIVLQNLHPVRPTYRSRLPGARPRVFVESDSFREVPLLLDTLWLDADAEKLILLWRGHVAAASLKLKEIKRLYVALERLADPPAPVEEHRRAMEERAAPPKAPAPEGAPPPREESAVFEEKMADLEKATATAKSRATALEAQIRASLAKHGRSLPAGPSMTPGEVEVLFARSLSRIQQISPAVAEKLGEVKLPPGRPPAGEPGRTHRRWTREDLQQAVAAGADLAGEDLARMDLSGLKLSGARLAGARLPDALLANAVLTGADLTGADLSRCDLSGADLSSARLEKSDLTQSRLSGARLKRALLSAANLSEADLSGSDLSEASGKGADFSRAKLVGASLCKAQLPSSDFSESDLANADLQGAVLPAASIEGARAGGAKWRDADLTGLHGSESPDLAGGDFRGIRGGESYWEGAGLDGADFTGAILTRADFSATSLQRAVFEKADLRGAVFAEADLRGAKIRSCDALRSSFEGARLSNGDLRGSNFYEAEFWNADTTGTLLDGANLKGTKLAREHGSRTPDPE